MKLVAALCDISLRRISNVGADDLEDFFADEAVCTVILEHFYDVVYDVWCLMRDVGTI